MFWDRCCLWTIRVGAGEPFLDENNTSIYGCPIFIQKSTSWPNQKSIERAQVTKTFRRIRILITKNDQSDLGRLNRFYIRKSWKIDFLQPWGWTMTKWSLWFNPKKFSDEVDFCVWISDVNSYHWPSQPGPQLSSTGTEMCSNSYTVSNRWIGTILHKVCHRAKMALATAQGA